MAEFRTIVDIQNSNIKLDYNSNIFLIGSCFADNIGEKFSERKFSTLVNPFGVVYNPKSVANTISSIIKEKSFSEDDLIYSDKWNSFYHHSRFSDEDKNACLDNINILCKESLVFLKKADFIIITFGTSWVYEYVELGKVVSNCHKLPSNRYNRYRLSVDDIVSQYRELLSSLKEINYKAKIIFTVSPVRHWKDGAHGNMLSKAVLHLAIDEIMKENKDSYYFPSYELVMDELRDYRFYSEDMLHISDVAVQYIWDRFIQVFLDEKSKLVMKRIEKIIKVLKHRPFSANSKSYKDLLRNTFSKIELLEMECKYLDFSLEKGLIKEVIKD